MSFKMSGEITQIGEKKVLDNGAVVLDYIVTETAENGFETPYNFNIYKGTEFAEFVDKFTEFNKVGDKVTVEFNIRGKEYKGRVYNNLSHWRCDKLESINEPTLSTKENDDLPF